MIITSIFSHFLHSMKERTGRLCMVIFLTMRGQSCGGQPMITQLIVRSCARCQGLLTGMWLCNTFCLPRPLSKLCLRANYDYFSWVCGLIFLLHFRFLIIHLKSLNMCSSMDAQEAPFQVLNLSIQFNNQLNSANKIFSRCILKFVSKDY